MEKTALERFKAYFNMYDESEKKRYEESLESLSRISKARDIAFTVAYNLHDVQGVDTVTLVDADFLDTLIALANNVTVGTGTNNVRTHVKNMLKETDWHDRRKNAMAAKKSPKAKEVIVRFEQVMSAEDAQMFVEFLLQMGFRPGTVSVTNFDGEASSTRPYLTLEGSATEIAGALEAIAEKYGDECLKNGCYTSNLNQFEKDHISLSQALDYARAESDE